MMAVSVMLYCDSYFRCPSVFVFVRRCHCPDYEYGKSVFFDTSRWTPAERSDECFLKEPS